jgi:hypothetical protein
MKQKKLLILPLRKKKLGLGLEICSFKDQGVEKMQ